MPPPRAMEASSSHCGGSNRGSGRSGYSIGILGRRTRTEDTLVSRSRATHGSLGQGQGKG